MTRFLLGPLVRLAGGDPVRVLALAGALHRDARGRRAWQHAQEGGGWFGPEDGRRLTLFVLALASISVSFPVRSLAAGQPWLAGIILCLAQFGAVILTTARDAVVLLLADEDRRIIGWWPASERELTLARCCLLLRGMLQTTLAVAGLPLAVLVVHAPRPLASGPGALIGLGLHTAALAALLVLGIRGFSRLVGLQWARRTIELLGVALLLLLTGQVGATGLHGLIPDLGDPTTNWQMLALPVSWFAAWFALWPPSVLVLSAAGLGAVASVAIVVVGLRRIVAGNRDVSERPPGVHCGRFDWTRPVMGWLRPWFAGREGRILMILLCAHLRRDWRLTGQLLLLPPLYLALIWRQVASESAPDPSGILTAVRAVAGIVLFLSLLGFLLGAAFTHTGEPSAAWILRSGVIDGRRMLVLQRRLLRILVAVPFLLCAALLLLMRMHLPWQILLPAAASSLLACELAVVVVQWIRPALPFSRAWRRGEQAGSHGHIWFLALLLPVILVWGRLVLERTIWGWLLTAAVLALLLVPTRVFLNRRVVRQGIIGLTPQR